MITFDDEPGPHATLRACAGWSGAPSRSPRLRFSGTRELDEDPRGSPRARAAAPHVHEPRIESTHVVSGRRRARIVHRADAFVVATGPEHDLWVLSTDAARRPRHTDRPGIVSLPLRIEPNGLVRVLDRRAAVATLIDALVHLGVAPAGTERPATRVPAGRYGRITVRDEGRHYAVLTRGGTGRRIERIACEPIRRDVWLVLEADEPRLRRELVRHLAPANRRRLLDALGRLAPGGLRESVVGPARARTYRRA